MIVFYGCSSKKEEHISTENTPIPNVTKSIQKEDIPKEDEAYLSLDDNTSIQISSKSIKTDICNDEKLIILNIFAPWDKVSVAQLKILDKLKVEKSDVCVISIAIDSDSNTSLPMEYKISHKVIFDLQNNDFVDKISGIINIDKNFKLPMNIIYKDNQYKNSYQGVMPLEMLRYIIKG